mgnify:CR=1 FL=1
MRTRKIEREINWNKKLGDTITDLGAGDIYAMNKFRTSSRDKQVKMMSDMRCILDAPKRSAVWNLAESTIGKDFEEVVMNVYNYGRLIINIQSARA